MIIARSTTGRRKYYHIYNSLLAGGKDCMEHTERRFSIGKKMYVFVLGIVVVTIIGIWFLSYRSTAKQIDRYYKRLTINSARNYASFVDPNYLHDLRELAESEEYQALRDQAEELEDDSLIEDYLREHGMWEEYEEQRDRMRTYVENMDDIDYLYIVAWADEASEDGEYYDMYILDADDVPLYETGYYEQREPEFEGFDPRRESDAVISNGDWGWLCSGYAPVYDRYGKLVCTVGCDVSMEDVMADRRANRISLSVSAVIYTIIVLIAAFLVVTRFVVRPLNLIAEEMKKFSPKQHRNYKESGVIDLKSTRHTQDEIDDIYNEIRSMQIRIIDYIDDITAIREEKEKAESEVNQISMVAYKDGLTGIGNKKAYIMKAEEFDRAIADGKAEFAIVMMDINYLKNVNDNLGHDAGDKYLLGCCHMICDILKHSPIYRIGGDEFAAILIGEDYNNRQERVAELESAFEKSFSNKEAEPYERYSASVGMSEYKSGDDSVDTVFKRADAQMYDAKKKFKQDHKL